MKKICNTGWVFCKKHIDNTAEEIIPELIAFSIPAEDFIPIAIPHDWLIWNTKNLYENSVGVYRRNIDIEEDIAASRYFLRFESIYMDSTVFVNGQKTIEWKYGYTTFETDITPFIEKGSNTVTVVSVYKSPNTRWYSGAGIFRDVWLITVPHTHLVSDGIAIGNTLCDDGSWTTEIQTEAVRHAPHDTPVTATESFPAIIRHTLIDASGTNCAVTEETVYLTSINTEENPYYFIDTTETEGSAYGVCVNKQILHIKSVHCWDIDDPYLYTLKTELIALTENRETVLDETEQHTGYRIFRFDKDNGFFLNGRHLKIHGVCQHHDLGALGAAFNLCALKRQFQMLKDMGVNSIRTSHNPPAPAFMELADKMGFLINSECFDMWEKPKTTYDYARFFNNWYKRDVASWIRRDRNHPSIIMWSIGNEIYDTHQGNGLQITKNLTALVHVFDPFRTAPVTIGSNYIEWEGAQRCMREVDVAGYNYSERLYKAHHDTFPHWCIYGSETSSTVQSRSVYHFPASFRTLTHDDSQCSSLNNCSANWGALSAEKVITDDRDTSFCSGQYIWTGWDYIGEPTPYFTKNSFFGQIDTAGFPKDTYYLYQAEWGNTEKPMVHLLPYWDFNESQRIDVRAYSNMKKVELFVNGVSQGAQNIDHEHGLHLAGAWNVPYTKGTILVAAYDSHNKIVATAKETTPEDPARIVITPDKAYFTDNATCGSQTDLIFVEISTVDSQNNPVPNARNHMEVSVTGAILAGLDNGDSTDYDQYKGTSKRLFNNKLLAILTPLPTATSNAIVNPAVIITVTSPGLPIAELKLSKRSQPAIQTAHVKLDNFQHKDTFIPIRKIELRSEGSRNLTPEHPTVTVTAQLYPQKEYFFTQKVFENLTWKPMRLEGSISPCARVEINGNQAVITGICDGEFRLRCSCTNGTDYPQIISELEFSVSGMGSGTLNPYSFVSACECSCYDEKPLLSFQSGVYMSKGRHWIGFDRVDFGEEGSDELTVPLFAFEDELLIEVWNGTPMDGRKISTVKYTAKSKYNHYQPNTWKLPCRLSGVCTISFVTDGKLSVQGFLFTRSSKAYSTLYAHDADHITGDTFTIEENTITGIGNNVSLEFNHMDFTRGISRIFLYGWAKNGANTVHVRFSNDDTTLHTNTVYTCILEIPQTSEYCEHVTDLSEQIKAGEVSGRQKVTFIFLPGSCFDFSYFRFE